MYVQYCDSISLCVWEAGKGQEALMDNLCQELIIMRVHAIMTTFGTKSVCASVFVCSFVFPGEWLRVTGAKKNPFGQTTARFKVDRPQKLPPGMYGVSSATCHV